MLQDQGWYLRSDIIWAKPNPMPESVRDRPTRAHEYLFLLTKSKKYWYDADAIRTDPKYWHSGSFEGGNNNDPRHGSQVLSGRKYKVPDGLDTAPGSHGTIHRNGREKGAKPDKQRGHSRRHAGFNDRWDLMTVDEQRANGANARSVWSIPTVGYPDAHFATFPPELPRRCILAGCPEGGLVLDPFAGSGTTGMVAMQLGRRFLGFEINPEYASMAERRIADVTPSMFTEAS